MKKKLPETREEICKYYGVDPNQKVESITFKPYSFKSKRFKISKELKRCLPFLFGGVFR